MYLKTGKRTLASAIRHPSSQADAEPKNAGPRRFIPVSDRFRHRYFISF
jgi:hypothetical protein